MAKKFNTELQQTPPEILVQLQLAKWEHKERVKLAELKNQRFERTCSLIEVIVIVGAFILVALLLRGLNPESLKTTLALITSIVTVAGTILVGIRKYRNRKKDTEQNMQSPKL